MVIGAKYSLDSITSGGEYCIAKHKHLTIEQQRHQTGPKTIAELIVSVFRGYRDTRGTSNHAGGGSDCVQAEWECSERVECLGLRIQD
jgi:hypothetical protein